MKNSILLLFQNPAATPSLEGLQAEWDIFKAATPQEGLQLLSQHPRDALLTDLPSTPETRAFLKTLAARFPKVVRLRAYGPSEAANRLASDSSIHQYVPAGCGDDLLLSAIQRARLLNGWFTDPAIQPLFSRLDKLPSVPSVYLRLLEALRSPETSTDQLGNIIAQDPATTAKILQLVNSAFFGLGHNIVSPGEAVSYLGIERVRSLVLLVHTFSNYEQEEAVPIKTEALSRHSLLTANLARALAREESQDAKTTEMCFTSGVLHDLGKLILAVNQPESYTKAIALAKERSMTLHAAEIEIFGASHAEIGACVLGIWGLPPEIIEAIAFHHQPNNHFWDAFGPVTAVHAADALIHEFRPDPLAGAQAALDLDYLHRLNVHERVPDWRGFCQDVIAQIDNAPAKR